MFDVGRSSFKTTPYGKNATCECLQNNLVLGILRPKLGDKNDKRGKYETSQFRISNVALDHPHCTHNSLDRYQ